MVLRSPTVAAQTDICDWIERNIALAQKAGSGQLTRLYPWQPEIFRAWVNPHIRQITGVLPAQMTKTTCSFGSALYSADVQPSPMIYVLPAEPDLIQMRAEKIDPMIDSCPPLRRANKIQDLKAMGKVGRRKANVDNEYIIQFGGGASLLFGTAAAERSLVGKTAQRVIADEIDKYKNWLRVKGNLLDRMEVYVGREKLFAISSPHGSAIMAEYRMSDMRQFWMPCVAEGCGQYQTFEWKNVRLEEIRENVFTGWLFCPHCGEDITDRMRRTMIDRGEWRAEHPEVEDHAGFHLNRFYDPNTTTAHICSRYSEQRMAKRMFYNGTLALEFKDSDEAKLGDEKWQTFFRAEPPWEEGPTAITIGVDVQANRLEYQVVLWYGGDYAFIDCHQTIMFPLQDDKPDPDPAFAALAEVYREVDPDMSLIDMGFKPEWVRAGIAKHLGFYRMTNRVLGCRGMARDSFDLPIVERPTGSAAYRHYQVATDEAKITFWDQMDRSMVYCRNVNVPENMREQLEAEQLVWVESPNGEINKMWQQVSERNEALDDYVYALAGKRTLRLDYDRRTLVAAGSRKQYPPAPQESR